MRICHFSDNHLGAGQGRREDDILEGFAQAINRIIELKPDLVINAGDLFHVVHPSNKVLAFVSKQLLRLGREEKIPTVIIAGNHDAPKQRYVSAALSIFEEYENIYPVYQSKYERIKIGEVSISAVPHCLNSEILHTELKKIEPDKNAKYNILTLHGAVAGIKEFQIADLSEQLIPEKYFRLGFDYVALGHYHNYSRVEPNAYYSGSTERLSQSEAAHEKKFIEVLLSPSDETPHIKYHKIPTRDMVDLPPVRAKGRTAEEILAELENQISKQKPEDKIIRIKVENIPEETYRSLPFGKISELKNSAFSLDIQFEKEDRPDNQMYSDLNMGRLDLAFNKFLDSKEISEEEKKLLRDMGFSLLNQIDSDK